PVYHYRLISFPTRRSSDLPGGLLYANIQAPIDTDAQRSDMGSRTGTSSSWAILGLVASGDASVNRAAREAEITTIDHVDYQYLKDRKSTRLNSSHVKISYA